MAHSSITDLMSLFGDILDFCRSAHEALLERRRKRAAARREAADPAPAREAQARDQTAAR